MRKLTFIFVFALAFVLLLSGCKTESTTTLNSEYKIVYGGSQIEATVRELKVDGGRTTARIRFLNLGSEELSSIEAQIEFIDGNGEIISTYIVQETFDTPIAIGASFSETAECDTNSKIKGVYVTEYLP